MVSIHPGRKDNSRSRTGGGGGGVAQSVECFPSMRRALGSNPSTALKNWGWWHSSEVLERWRQEGHKFKAILSYIVILRPALATRDSITKQNRKRREERREGWMEDGWIPPKSGLVNQCLLELFTGAWVSFGHLNHQRAHPAQVRTHRSCISGFPGAACRDCASEDPPPSSALDA